MTGRLSRKRERASILVCAVSSVGAVVGMLAEWTAVAWLGCLGIFLGVWISEPCPGCGNRTRRLPRWSKPGWQYCSFCGIKFMYDDEPEEN